MMTSFLFVCWDVYGHRDCTNELKVHEHAIDTDSSTFDNP